MDYGQTTVNELLDFGVPRALFWNAGNRDLKIPNEEMIVRGLGRGYNERIISIFIDYFGVEEVRTAFENKRSEISTRFYEAVISVLSNYKKEDEK